MTTLESIREIIYKSNKFQKVTIRHNDRYGRTLFAYRYNKGYVGERNLPEIVINEEDVKLHPQLTMKSVKQVLEMYAK